MHEQASEIIIKRYRLSHFANISHIKKIRSVSTHQFTRMSTTETPLSTYPERATQQKSRASEIAEIERVQELVVKRIQLLQSQRKQLQRYLDLIRTLDDDDDDDDDEQNDMDTEEKSTV